MLWCLLMRIVFGKFVDVDDVVYFGVGWSVMVLFCEEGGDLCLMSDGLFELVIFFCGSRVGCFVIVCWFV